MSFRSDESSKALIQEAREYLIGRTFPQDLRKQATNAFYDLVAQYGPVVKGYPIWHPLVAVGNTKHEHWTHPTSNRSYNGLDHVVLFRDAFLACPYGGASQIISSVNSVRDSKHYIHAEELDTKLYHPDAFPVLVYYQWDRPLNNDGTIPQSLAVPLMLESELPQWRTSQVGETWASMRSSFLGSPHGQSSSLFVNKETGTKMKSLWNALIYTGMFGPLYVG